MAKKLKKFNGEGKQLSVQVEKSLKKYFIELDGELPVDIYAMVLKVLLRSCCYTQGF